MKCKAPKKTVYLTSVLLPGDYKTVWRMLFYHINGTFSNPLISFYKYSMYFMP